MECDFTFETNERWFFLVYTAPLAPPLTYPEWWRMRSTFDWVSHWLIFIVFFSIDSGPRTAKFHHSGAHNRLGSLFPIFSTRFRPLLFANWLDQLFNSQLKLKHTPTSLFLCTSFRDECGEKKTFNSIIIIRPKRCHRTDTWKSLLVFVWPRFNSTASIPIWIPQQCRCEIFASDITVSEITMRNSPTTHHYE